MPYFRGIDISVHASLEAKQITEYPHPDGSSVRLLRAPTLPAACDASAGTGQASQPGTPSTARELDPTRLKKVNPRISVYIPSLPGEQFWLRYLISQSPPPSRCIFFKMTMNGRHIASWGINTHIRPTGIVVRALYQPEDRWGDAWGSDEAGYPGIETRYFHFMPGLDTKSVAEDGGVIEVQVFRCKGRKRIALELNVYRNQEHYGITSPSGGLVDNPQDATYYNYYLIDAKDAPYATFCFHYRSMKYLKQLNLVPQVGLDLSPGSKNSLGAQPERSVEEPKRHSNSPLARRFTFDGTPMQSHVFDGGFDTTQSIESVTRSNDQDEYFLKSPPEFSPSALRMVIPKSLMGTPETELLAEMQQRPLPEIPDGQARPASASSLRSNLSIAISLTPSLKQYVESEDFENEEIRLSTAQPMLISSESMQALELVDAGAEEGASFSDYASSPSSTATCESPKLPSPDGYIPTTGSVLERHLTQYDSPITRSSPPQSQIILSSRAGDAFNGDPSEPRTRVINLTEAEWLRQTPSPLQRGDHGAEHPWSPGPASRIGGAVRVSDDNGLPQNRTDAIDQAPAGNWI
ncbi:hypothetical protein F4802DRAFT_26790 [Xylaria palmicola]|nr:hypothetical protein F4802DRAFT_26790 [Xylaria palmicola]